MADLLYAYEKLSAGVETLATHPHEVNERLIAVFHDQVGVNPDCLPEEPKRIWLEVMKIVEREGSLSASIYALDEAGAVNLAKMITTVKAMVRSVI